MFGNKKPLDVARTEEHHDQNGDTGISSAEQPKAFFSENEPIVFEANNVLAAASSLEPEDDDEEVSTLIVGIEPLCMTSFMLLQPIFLTVIFYFVELRLFSVIF